jgi:hypothetical protein
MAFITPAAKAATTSRRAPPTVMAISDLSFATVLLRYHRLPGHP